MDENIDVAARKTSLPYSGWWPALAGALFGILLRLVYSGRPNFPFDAMSNSFMLLAPIAVGALTVYFAEKSKRRSWRYYLAVPALANLLFVAGTMLIMIEGLICAVIAAPLFAFLGAVGGLLMGAVCRVAAWPRHAAYAFMVLPFVFGALPADDSADRDVAVTQRTIQIAASPAVLWHQLLDARDIRADEVGQAWMYRIGVPLPLSGVTQQSGTGLVRKVMMGKSIHFDQVATEWEVNRFVRWRYRFSDDSFPPGALDEHVKIGGHYFDMIDTEYELAPLGAHSTELKISMHYRVSTPFNWYAKPVARLLIANFEEVILRFYRRRSTSAAA